MPASSATVSTLRALPPFPVDPFDEELRALSYAGIDWLIENAFVVPDPASPLTPRYAYRGRRSRAEREEAGAELARRGLVSRAWVPDERRTRMVEQSSLGRALAILEQPRRLLRLGLGTPSGDSREVRLYIADGRAVVSRFDDEGAAIGTPFSLVALLAYLAEQLAGDHPSSDDALCLWPSLFRLATALWPECGRADDEELCAGELAALLDDDPGATRAHSLLTEMVHAGVAEKAGSGIVLSRRYRRWLEPVWSGHVFEIECARLDDGNPAVTGRLIFAGPRGERVLCQDAASRTLLADAAGSRSAPPAIAGLHAADSLPDEGLMVFSRLSRDELYRLVTDLLGARQPSVLRAAAL